MAEALASHNIKVQLVISSIMNPHSFYLAGGQPTRGDRPSRESNGKYCIQCAHL